MWQGDICEEGLAAAAASLLLGIIWVNEIGFCLLCIPLILALMHCI